MTLTQMTWITKMKFLGNELEAKQGIQTQILLL